MLAAAQHLLDLTAQRAVQLPRIVGRLEELTRLTPPLEFGAGEEMVCLTVPLAGSRLAGRRGYRVPEGPGSPSPQLTRDCRLATPGRSGEHDDPRRHSRLSSCSRTFSSSPFIAMTVCVMAASLAFEPIVLTSRSSSCARNQSCFPTAPSDRSASWHAASCVRTRTSS